LVTREPDDFEIVGVRGFEVFVEFFEACELRREAAFAGCVDDEDDFVLEVRERVGGALLFDDELVLQPVQGSEGGRGYVEGQRAGAGSR
jgi:hypothetical protein